MNQESTLNNQFAPANQASDIRYPSSDMHVYIKNDSGVIDRVVRITSSEFNDSVEIEYSETDNSLSSFRY
jgi:hypothetical protein